MNAYKFMIPHTRAEGWSGCMAFAIAENEADAKAAIRKFASSENEDDDAIDADWLDDPQVLVKVIEGPLDGLKKPQALGIVLM